VPFGVDDDRRSVALASGSVVQEVGDLPARWGVDAGVEVLPGSELFGSVGCWPEGVGSGVLSAFAVCGDVVDGSAEVVDVVG
jgi:hypothetical protein